MMLFTYQRFHKGY